MSELIKIFAGLFDYEPTKITVDLKTKPWAKLGGVDE